MNLKTSKPQNLRTLKPLKKLETNKPENLPARKNNFYFQTFVFIHSHVDIIVTSTLFRFFLQSIHRRLKVDNHCAKNQS